MKKVQLLLLSAALISGLISSGCATNRIEGNEIPEQPQANDVTVPPPATAEAPPPVPEAPPAAPTAAPTEVPTPEPAANPCNKYIVVKGDTLWDISGSNNGYNDNWLWPLIFKANRDQITDPDLIYPKQEFCIRQDFDDKDKKKAHKDAVDTPKYVPHTKPRETLPLNYF